MKFQKILIIAYLSLQIILLMVIVSISGQYSVPYIGLVAASMLLFMIVHLRDPGYLMVEEKVEPEINDADGFDQEPNILKSEAEKQGENDIRFSLKKKTISAEEKQFCSICMIHQPYRTKHCHQCQKCVATFDHHCPWMNNCIGEKNRPIFVLFLIIQACQLFVGSVIVCSVALNRISPMKAELLLGITLILLLCILFGLLIFHLYLMLTNLTTWQLARWDRISYLKSHKRNAGSPFSKGVFRDMMEYCVWGFRKSRKIWEFEN